MESQNNNPIKTNLPSSFGKTNKKQIIVEDSDSDWSMDSLEQIKGQNLKEIVDQDNELQLQQNNNEVHINGNNGNPQKGKKQLKVVFPEKPFVGEASSFTPFGKIISYVGELIVVESFTKELNGGSGSQMEGASKIVVDLDNWLFDKNKKIIGFVMDVLGKIDHPFYVIKSQAQGQKILQFPVGSEVFYVQGSKILREEDISSIMSKTAMDVENISDQSDQENEVENLSDGQLQFDKPQQSENNHYRGKSRGNGNEMSNRRFQPRKQEHREDYSAQHYPSQNRNNRSRTRQHLRSRRTDRDDFEEGRQNRQNRPNRLNQNESQMNQAYLNGMYSLYHQQMMHLQYGTPLPNQVIPQNQMQIPPIFNMPNYSIPPNFNPNNSNLYTNRNQQNQQNRPF